MKRTLEDLLEKSPNDRLEKSSDDEHKKKIYKSGDIILIEDNYKIKYEIESERNIFIRHYATIKCPLCKKNISECIGMGMETDPSEIKFESTQLENHFRQSHKDEIISIKKSIVNINKQIVELVLTKKVIL
jgi:hypothetical protein